MVSFAAFETTKALNETRKAVMETPKAPTETSKASSECPKPHVFMLFVPFTYAKNAARVKKCLPIARIGIYSAC